MGRRGVAYHRLVALLVLVAGLAGCRGAKGLVAVEGRVRFAGRTPPAPGTLYFVPREMSKDLARDRSGSLPGTAVFLEDGSFRAGTFTQGDGLRPGTYEVRIECVTKTGGAGIDPHEAPRRCHVPAAFQPPDLVIPGSGTQPVRYDLDVP
ncbi:MAG: hypothetical protein ACKOCN_10065 [Planctomycetaceae bacterium]